MSRHALLSAPHSLACIFERARWYPELRRVSQCWRAVYDRYGARSDTVPMTILICSPQELDSVSAALGRDTGAAVGARTSPPLGSSTGTTWAASR